MIAYLESLFRVLRPAFSRRATFAWFVVAFMGFVMRQDTFGVSSIVRALWLDPRSYPCLLHFFHSTAWTAQTLLECWWQWLIMENVAYRTKGRIVLVGDHTKTPKDGRRMPEVTTLHQDSETASKPRYFRGHHWGCIGLLVQAGERFFATPMWAEIHNDSLEESRATRIVSAAETIATAMASGAYLVLDAFFAVGPVFKKALQHPELIHILTRAKKNVVAYETPRARKKRGPGRPRQYGRKLKLAKLFDSRPHKFKTTSAQIYQQREKVRYLTLDLIWRPVKQQIRFLLVESSRGRIILMTSDLTLTPVLAIELYCRRVTIETLFDRVKNILGGMRYPLLVEILETSLASSDKKSGSQANVSAPRQNPQHLPSNREVLRHSARRTRIASAACPTFPGSNPPQCSLLATDSFGRNPVGIRHADCALKHRPNEFTAYRKGHDNAANPQEAAKRWRAGKEAKGQLD